MDKLANLTILVFMEFTSTELKNKLGDAMTLASKEPVTISQHGKPAYALLSIQDLERMQAAEDHIWATLAQDALSEGKASSSQIAKIAKKFDGTV